MQRIVLAIGLLTATSVLAQTAERRLLLKYASFDPLLGAPMVPANLVAGSDTNLHIVQFRRAFTDADRDAIRELGGKLHSPLPHHALIVRMDATRAATAGKLATVRWVGPYHPAYRLEGELLTELVAGKPLPVRKYNMVMADKRHDKAALQRRIEGIGGAVTDRHERGLLMTAELTGDQLIAAARLDEVLWIDRWTPPEIDMNNARTVQGTDHVETLAGYVGTGIRGHVYEGVEATHPDFNVPMTNVQSGGGATDHGHATAGCIWGNGTSSVFARGHSPGGIGFYTEYGTVTASYSRNMVIDEVVNVHNCLFTSASWGGQRTTQYTGTSADSDDVVFDHRIPWTQSQSNAGNTMSRPEAWAKNVISIGGVIHNDNADPTDDLWGGSGSTGPASDGRIKPDLSNFYDDVWTSDRTGTAGYTNGNSTSNFGGTSAATPITAGTGAIAIEMFLAGEFHHTPRVPGGTGFQNRPYAQTLKALQIACATPYQFSQGSRFELGWGYPSIDKMYDRRHLISIVPEDTPITQGATHTYPVTVPSGLDELKVCMSFLDPAGNPAASVARINDLTLEVVDPNGARYWGNRGLTQTNNSLSGGSSNTVDTVECVFVLTPTAGQWTIEITAPVIAQDAHAATTATDATYALVINGAIGQQNLPCARHAPNPTTTGTAANQPFGGAAATSLPTLMGGGQSSGPGSTAFFDALPFTEVMLTGLDLNTNTAVGTELVVDVFTTPGTYAGNATTRAAWTARTAGHGVAATVNTPTSIEFNQPVRLTAFMPTGIAVVARNFSHRHTTGATQSFSDANVACTVGAIATGTFAGSVLGSELPNVTLKYRTDADPEGNQVYQAIVRQGQLGAIAGNITGLAFVPAATGAHYNETLEIRMARLAPGSTPSATFAANMTNATTVLAATHHSWHVLGGEWNEIGLQQPFAYDGLSDVIVEVRATGNHSSGAGGFLRGDTPIPRVWTGGFAAGTPPATGAVDDLGLRMRLSFDCAFASEFGTSCGLLRAGHQASPIHGTTFTFTLANAVPNSGAFLAAGFANTAPYPQDLGQFGFTNCMLWHDVVTTVFKLTDSSGASAHAFALPSGNAFDGVIFYAQWFQPDPSQPGGVAASDYTRLVIGRTDP